jgi:hypothetical protein
VYRQMRIKQMSQLDPVRLGNKPDLSGVSVKFPEQLPRFSAYLVQIACIDYLLTKGTVFFPINKLYGIFPKGLNGDNLDNLIGDYTFQPVSRPYVLQIHLYFPGFNLKFLHSHTYLTILP